MVVKGIEGFGHVKFVSYTGKFPCLCEGVLTLLIDGEKVTFGNKYSNKVDYTSFWRSGGRIDNDYNAHHGEWIFPLRRMGFFQKKDTKGGNYHEKGRLYKLGHLFYGHSRTDRTKK